MTRRALAVLTAAALVILATAGTALATGAAPPVTMSADAFVPEGAVHHGELVAVFGDVRIEGTVTGEVVVVMGSLYISGTVESDVVSVLSPTTLTETSVVNGDLVNVGWQLDQEPGSRVRGELVTVNFMSLLPFVEEGGFLKAIVLCIFILKLALLTLLFLFLVLISALAPRRLSIIAAALPRRWGWAILAGLITWAAFLVTCLLLCITIIGCPLAMALSLAMLLTKWLGLAAVFYLVGQTIGRNLFHRELTHLSSVLGGFVIYALIYLIPMVGIIICLVLDLLAVGIVVLTRFGSEEASTTAAAGPPPPPSPPSAGAPPVVSDGKPSPQGDPPGA